MARLEHVDVDDLREWLEHVQDRESAQFLMIAIAAEEGVDVGDLASWYGVDRSDIDEWFDTVNERSIVSVIAETEGVDFDQLAEWYGLSPSTIEDWFEELRTAPVEDAAAVIDRYSQRSSAPVVRQTEARVEYLDYDVLVEKGWAIADDDLFEKASEAGLDPEQYGRVLVEPGETILEAAENRGMSWPYACRGGACANCAVLVKSGDIAMPGNHVLTDDQIGVMNARLTCVGVPVTDRVQLIMNVQKLDQFEGLRLPSPHGSGELSPP